VVELYLSFVMCFGKRRQSSQYLTVLRCHQVHVDTGYASENPDVQSMMAGMDETAALLANRTDCGFDSELNFDALLLGGYYCHECLPDNNGALCDFGGTCTNVQWLGYVCDNEFIVIQSDPSLVMQNSQGVVFDPSEILLDPDVTYRFTIRGESLTVCVDNSGEDSTNCATNGPLFVGGGGSFGEIVRLEDQDGNVIELKASSTDRDAVDNTTAGASTGSDERNAGLIAGVTVAAAVVVFAAAMFVLRKRGVASEGKQSGVNSTTMESSSQGSNDAAP